MARPLCSYRGRVTALQYSAVTPHAAAHRFSRFLAHCDLIESACLQSSCMAHIAMTAQLHAYMLQ